MSIGNENIHQKGEIPEITKLPNGRLRVVRRFHKFTREDVDDANLGSLMGDFGDLDNENEPIADQGYDDCRLISVQVDNRFNSVTNAENPVLVKTYETLTNAFVQIDDDTESTTESGLKTVTKVFRAKSNTTDSGTVGITKSGNLTLASSKLVDNDAFAELTQVFSEAGILNIDTDKKYGGIITVTSITAFNLSQSEVVAQSGVSGTFLDSQTKNSGGFETNVFRFVEGSGEIDRSTSEKGILKKTTITSINEHPEYAFGVLVDQKTDTRDFGIVYTHTYAEGSGTVRDVVSTSLGGKLTTTSITSLGVEPTIPTGAAIIESSSSIENGLTLFKVTHVQGQGQVSASTNPNYGGKLNVVTITSLNEEPTSSGDLVDTDVKAGNGYILYTYSFASGSGEISRQSNPEYSGALTRTTIASINTEPSASGALVDSKVSTQDGFTLYEYTFVEGQGVISTNTNSEYNGALSKTTISSINQEPNGFGVLTDSKVDARDGFTLYTYTYVSGAGEVSRTSNPEYGGKLTRQIITAINEEPSGNGALVDAKTSQGDGYILYTYQYVTGFGEIGRTSNQQYNGALTLTTISAIDQEPSSEGALVKSDVKTQDGYVLYTYTFASGRGEVSRKNSSEHQGKLTRTTITSINEVPNADGALVDARSSSGDGYILYTYQFLRGEGEISRQSNPEYNGKLTITTISSINTPPNGGSDALVDSKIEANNGYTIYTNRYARGSGEIARSTSSAGRFNRTTISAINEMPNVPAGGTIVDSKVEAKDGFFIGTITTATPKEGVLSTKTGVGPIPTSTLTTIVQFGTEPSGSGDLYSSKIEIVDGIELYTYQFLNVAGGNIANYQDPIEVEVAGEVNCSTEQVNAGGESGTIAIVNAKPISRKTVIANVSIEITSSPQSSGAPAYSLEGIGCSVVSTNASLRVGGGNTVTVGTEKNKMTKTGFQKSFSASARSNTYTGCVLQSAQSSGSISYTAEERPKIVNGNIQQDTETSSTNSTCRGTSSGGTQATTGLVRSRARPLLTTPSGQTWFEQITWTV